LLIEFLVEDASTEAFLEVILPKILDRSIFDNCQIHQFGGKDRLLKNLSNRLKGYKNWITDDDKIVVLIDRDRDDCRELKNKIEEIAKDAGLITKSLARDNLKYAVLNRIVIEELEAWYFGDINAICKAYPGVSDNLDKRKGYRDPDSIKGGTAERLKKVLSDAGYHNHQGRLPKTQVAKDIAQYMEPRNNRSESFQIFYTALQEMTSLKKMS
jgi:hypothetical protein